MNKSKNKLLPLYIVLGIIITVSAGLFIASGFINLRNNKLQASTTNSVEATSGSAEKETINSETESETEEETFFFEEPTTKEEFVSPDVEIIPGAINFALQVNIGTNVVTVFAKDENGQFTIPYKAMTCSSGLATEEYPEPTPLGNFNLQTSHIWCRMVDWTYSQYSYFIYSDIMFHSTPVALDYNIIEGEFPSPVYSVYSDA